MESLIITEKHFSMTSSIEVAEICRPFLNDYHFNAFIYGRVFDSGRAYGLVTHPDYHFQHINRRFTITPPVSPSIMTNHFSYMLDSNSAFDEARYCQ